MNTDDTVPFMMSPVKREFDGDSQSVVNGNKNVKENTRKKF